MRENSKFKKGFTPIQSGFTLIELLVVIAVVGVLAGAVVAIINPTAMFDRARISKGKSFEGQMTRSLGFQTAGMFTFNNASSPTEDSSGSSVQATLFGPTYIPECNLGMSGCYSFNGTSDYMTLTHPPIQSSPNIFTIAAFIKPDDQNSMLVTPYSNGIDQYILYDNTNKRLAVNIAEGGDVNVRARYSKTGSVPLNTWTHFAVSIKNLHIKIFINGSLDSEYDETIPIANWDGVWYIGQRGNSTFWYKGQIDDLQIFGEAI